MSDSIIQRRAWDGSFNLEQGVINQEKDLKMRGHASQLIWDPSISLSNFL